MDDSEILDLYFARSEQAIVQTDQKYGFYCYSIAKRILSDPLDAEESVNDTYYSCLLYTSQGGQRQWSRWRPQYTRRSRAAPEPHHIPWEIGRCIALE